jgi:hypothetical protein
MALVYEMKNDLNQSLSLMKKAKFMLEAVLPNEHPDLMKINIQIRRLDDKLKRR